MTAYYNENDPFAAEWLRQLIDAKVITPGVVDDRSIQDVTPNDLKGFTQCHFFAGIGVWSYALRLAGWPDNKPVWTGSCPCQPFSSAGKGTGLADPRHLWPDWFWLIQYGKRPEVPIFGEQVASKDGLAWFDIVSADLENEGYTCRPVDICAAGVGAPHIRQRLYWAADSDDAGPQGRRRGMLQERTNQLVTGAGGESGGVGNPSLLGRQQQSEGNRSDGTGVDAERGKQIEFGQTGGDIPHERTDRPGPVNGFWRDADWLFCRDQKFRPVRPGSFPLANGTPGRVGRLRAYGNAINAEAAKEFIKAYMMCTLL